MSGFAGSSPAKKQRQGLSISRRPSRSLKAECAGRVVGPAALIAESDAPDIVQLCYNCIHEQVRHKFCYFCFVFWCGCYRSSTNSRLAESYILASNWLGVSLGRFKKVLNCYIQCMKYFLVAAVILILAGGLYFLLVKPFSVVRSVACTTEAKQCPDGSYVGRTGPDCAFAACPAPGQGQSGSGIQGIVLLGPTCPVERNPPDPQCADKFYQTSLVVTTSDGTQTIKTFSSDADGKFSVQLPPGAYAIRSAPSSSMLPRCSTGTIDVGTAAYASTNIYCDTGIR